MEQHRHFLFFHLSSPSPPSLPLSLSPAYAISELAKMGYFPPSMQSAIIMAEIRAFCGGMREASDALDYKSLLSLCYLFDAW